MKTSQMAELAFRKHIRETFFYLIWNNQEFCDELVTNVLNFYHALQRNGPWPKINLSNTWTCAWPWWTERPALSSSCKPVEKTTADRWVDYVATTSLAQPENLVARPLTFFVVALPEMGANWVQLEASSRGQQPVPGQPKRQDGRPHRGGLQPQPQPAVEVHPQSTIIGGATDPPGQSEITAGDRLQDLQREMKKTGGQTQTGWICKSLLPQRRGADGPVGPVRGPLPRLNKK